MIFHKPICSFDDQTASVAWHFVSNDRPNNWKRFCSIWPERRAAYSSSLFAYLTIRKNNVYRRSILLFDIDHGIRYEHLPIYLDTRRIDYTDYPIVYCFPRDKPITRASDFRAPTRDLHATYTRPLSNESYHRGGSARNAPLNYPPYRISIGPVFADFVCWLFFRIFEENRRRDTAVRQSKTDQIAIDFLPSYLER